MSKEAGSRMLQNLLPLFSDEERAVIAEKLGGNEKALEELGKATLRQDEFSRKMNETQQLRSQTEEWRNRLSTWDAEKKAEYDRKEAELAAARAALQGSGSPAPGQPAAAQPAIDTSRFVSADVLERKVAEAISYATNYGAFITPLVVQHLKDFDEVLDTGKLIEHCRVTGKPIDQGGYESFVKDKRDARARSANEQALKEAEERGFRRAQQESVNLPYVSSGAEPGGTLSGLGKEKGNAVAAAVATYNTLTQGKG
jgi:hypothetical protein